MEPNLPILEELYARYSHDPASVHPSWRNWFEKLNQRKKVPVERIEQAPVDTGEGQRIEQAPVDTGEGQRIEQAPVESIEKTPLDPWVEAYRHYGHLMAAVNPLFDSTAKVPELQGAPQDPQLALYKEVYTGSMGIELGEGPVKEWLESRLERPKEPLKVLEKQMILQQLNKSELLETFLHTKFVGQKRFSLEGGETLIPCLKALIEGGGESFIIGMSHRGRLNVLCNIFNKSYGEVFAEFDEQYEPKEGEGTGDVKYHKGFSADLTTESGKMVHLELAPNASHLESVDPVVEGMARAIQTLQGDQERSRVIPVLIHGDAALSGQGVVYETLQLSQLQGYTTGGTIHFVINNQIGFTTLPRDGRSTHYCTDIAKAFGLPVFHVNVEDPEACVFATHLAFEVRQKFHIDVFIDLYCYRKYGHNEGDEPSFTQPKIYQLIRKKRTIRELYRDFLIHEGTVEKYMAEALEAEFKKALHMALKEGRLSSEERSGKKAPQDSQKPAIVDKKELQGVADQLLKLPDGFHLHSKIGKLFNERFRDIFEGKPLDWGVAETLAYGTLLHEGRAIRLTGQDSCRGTFSHRHALFVDQENEDTYIPLKSLGQFELYNSPLSENAAMGFEFGYSVAAEEALVIWEAQFGDFANGAQVVIDQYLVPCLQKWGQSSALTLFLPHGYEGQGPEHSSARIERYLIQAADANMRIANPTTPAQFFHLLRRQALDPVRKPLVVFTPKGLLRHPECVSRIEDLIEGQFQEVLDDPERPKRVKRIIFCSGRIYYDLAAERSKREAKGLAIVRLEQLYPFPKDALKAILDKYEGYETALWVQEEPENMGAWEFVERQFPKPIHFVGRSRSSASAVGSHALHKRQQVAILEKAFKPFPIRLTGRELKT